MKNLRRSSITIIDKDSDHLKDSNKTLLEAEDNKTKLNGKERILVEEVDQLHLKSEMWMKFFDVENKDLQVALDNLENFVKQNKKD